MTKSSSGCRQGVMHCTVIINKSDYIKKVNNIIKEGMQQGKYMENMDSTQSDLKHFKFFFTVILKNQIMIKCVQILTKRVDYLHLLKHTNLHH